MGNYADIEQTKWGQNKRGLGKQIASGILTRNLRQRSEPDTQIPETETVPETKTEAETETETKSETETRDMRNES